MFRGNHPAKVDEKGRLKLPAAFKQLLDAQSVTQFYITSVDGKSAQIWPLPVWEKREALLMESSEMDIAVKKYLELTSYYGQQVEMDNQARVLLPQILRGAAGLDSEVAVRGMMSYLDVKNLQKLEESVAASEMTAEESQSLAEMLKRRS